MLKTYIFDFDGTIADTLQLTIDLFNELSPNYGYQKIDEASFKVLRHTGAKAFFMGLGVDTQTLARVLTDIKQKEGASIENIPVFSGLPKALKELKHKEIKLGILTSNTSKNVALFLNKHQINIFDFIVSSARIFSKADVLETLLAEQNLVLGQTAYIGDEDRDIISAKKVGLKTVAVTWGYNSEELLQSHNPDYLIRSPEALLNL